MIDKQIFDIDAEKSVIGAILINRDEPIIPKLRGRLLGSHFYHTAYGRLYNILCEMFNLGSPIDSVTLKDYLVRKGELDKLGGIGEIVSLFEYVPHSSNWEYYAQIIIKHYVSRTLANIDHKRLEVVSRGGDLAREIPALRNQEDEVLKLASPSTNLNDLYEMSVKELETIQKGYDMTTGLSEVDSYSLGLSKNKLYIIAGEISHGKTALAIWLAVHNIANKKLVKYYNFDISAVDCLRRMVGVCYKMPMYDLYSPHPDDRILNEYKKNCAEFIQNTKGILFIDQYKSLSEIECGLATEPCDLLIIDYLQTAFAYEPDMSKYSVAWSIGKYVARLKELASKYNICVIGLSQYKRRIKKDNRFQERENDDLKESGYLEQSANVILLLDWEYRRDSTANINKYDINISKSTFGKYGKVIVNFCPNTQRFSDWKGQV